MKFTYDAYETMLCLLKKHKYEFCNYDDYENVEKAVILRHDVDMSLESALRLAELEYKNAVKSTYFVLLSTDFYNIFSKKSLEIIRKLHNMGHTIGLHFDEIKYECKSINDIIQKISSEIKVLELCIGNNVNVVSMHRPSQLVLNNDIKIKNVINSYSKEFFIDFKYLSDSRMNWRENLEEVILLEKYKKLHILTHAFWYKDKEQGVKDIFLTFINQSKYSTFNSINDNFKNLSEFINVSDI